MIRFSAVHLKHLMPFMGRGDIRHYLDSIHIEPHQDGGAVLVASNGHMMMCVRDPDAICTEAMTFRINSDAEKFGSHRTGGATPFVHINPVTERLIIIGDTDGEETYVQPGKCLVTSAVMKAGYPDWKKVVPAFDKLTLGATSSVQAKFYAAAAKAHPLKNARIMAAMRFWQTETLSSVVVEFCGAPQYMLLIMPYRDPSTPGAALESWTHAFKRIQAPITQEAA